MGWPRYLVEKRPAGGAVAYYWRPLASDLNGGFTLHAEKLGQDFATAKARADELNQHLDDWRAGKDEPRDLDLQPGFGTLQWLVERYKRSPAWEKVSARSRPDYQRAFDLLTAVPRKSGKLVGEAALKSIDAKSVDKIYARLREGPRGTRTRQANLCILRAARAWDVVYRLYPNNVPSLNPFRDVELTYGNGERPAATREQAIALHQALVNAGEPHLAAAPLVCLEWMQRPENVIGGHLAWTDYRPAERPDFVRIEHHKTGAMVWAALSDDQGEFSPLLTAYLDGLPRLGVAVVLLQPIVNRFTGARGPARSFKMRDARARVRDAARAAGLPDWLTLDACRRAGLNEIADADLTETQEMAMSGHTTPNAKRRYVKRSEAQRLIAARKRRAWVAEQEQKVTTNRNAEAAVTRNARGGEKVTR